MDYRWLNYTLASVISPHPASGVRVMDSTIMLWLGSKSTFSTRCEGDGEHHYAMVRIKVHILHQV